MQEQPPTLTSVPTPTTTSFSTPSSSSFSAVPPKRKISLKMILGGLVLLLLLVGSVVGYYLFTQNTDIRQQAAASCGAFPDGYWDTCGSHNCSATQNGRCINGAWTCVDNPGNCGGSTNPPPTQTTANRNAGDTCTVGQSDPASGGCDGGGPLSCYSCPASTNKSGQSVCSYGQPGSADHTNACGGAKGTVVTGNECSPGAQSECGGPGGTGCYMWQIKTCAGTGNWGGCVQAAKCSQFQPVASGVTTIKEGNQCLNYTYGCLCESTGAQISGGAMCGSGSETGTGGTPTITCLQVQGGTCKSVQVQANSCAGAGSGYYSTVDLCTNALSQLPSAGSCDAVCTQSSGCSCPSGCNKSVATPGGSCGGTSASGSCAQHTLDYACSGDPACVYDFAARRCVSGIECTQSNPFTTPKTNAEPCYYGTNFNTPGYQCKSGYEVNADGTGCVVEGSGSGQTPAEVYCNNVSNSSTLSQGGKQQACEAKPEICRWTGESCVARPNISNTGARCTNTPPLGSEDTASGSCMLGNGSLVGDNCTRANLSGVCTAGSARGEGYNCICDTGSEVTVAAPTCQYGDNNTQTLDAGRTVCQDNKVISCLQTSSVTANTITTACTNGATCQVVDGRAKCVSSSAGGTCTPGAKGSCACDQTYQQWVCPTEGASAGKWTCVNSVACGYGSGTGGTGGGTTTISGTSCPDNTGTVLYSAIFTCPGGDKNNDGQCTGADGAQLSFQSGKYTTAPTGSGVCWQIDYYKAGSITSPNWNAYCGHMGTPELCEKTTDSGSPAPSPTTPPAPMCLNIVMSKANPVIGDQVTFTCGQVAGVTNYQFRTKLPTGQIQDIAASAAGSNTSQALTISAAGTYYAQCQVCNANGCSGWENLPTN